MKRILVVADPYGSKQRVIGRATEIAEGTGAAVDVVGFAYEHLANQAVAASGSDEKRLREAILEKHRQSLAAAVDALETDTKISVDVRWEKRVADWVVERVEKRKYDMVVKTGHRSETFLYTSTDWQLLRRCAVPVLIVADKRWKGGKHVMAAVDLGTKVKSKRALNIEVVRVAETMAKALGRKLHVGYVAPFSEVLRDLDVIDKRDVRREGTRLAKEFEATLAERGVDAESVAVAVGMPEKALVSLAAKNRIGLVVLGCAGRKNLAGRVLGNTAEQILRLVKADVLAVKP